MSQTLWVDGECGWCRQCGRERAREGRRQAIRETETGKGMVGYREGYGRGRFVRRN